MSHFETEFSVLFLDIEYQVSGQTQLGRFQRHRGSSWKFYTQKETTLTVKKKLRSTKLLRMKGGTIREMDPQTGWIAFDRSSANRRKKNNIKIVVSVIRRWSMKAYLTCLSIVRFSYFPTFQTEFLSWANLFCDSRPSFCVQNFHVVLQLQP